MPDGGAGVHMTAALVLHDAAVEAAAAAGSGAAGAQGAGTGGGGGGGQAAEAAAALLAERDEHVRSFLDSYPEAMDSENDEFLYGRAGYLQARDVWCGVGWDGVWDMGVVCCSQEHWQVSVVSGVETCRSTAVRENGAAYSDMCRGLRANAGQRSVELLV